MPNLYQKLIEIHVILFIEKQYFIVEQGTWKFTIKPN